MPSGASSFLSGKQGPVPMTQTRIWNQDSSWWASVKNPVFGALDGDQNLSDRGLKDTKAHSLKKGFCVSSAAGQEKEGS